MALTIGEMTAKERLQKVVDDLTEAEAERALALVRTELADPVIEAFRNAPKDDEAWTGEDTAAIAEVEADRAAGVPRVPLEEIERELGIR
jgi:hypothetical protein